MEAEAGTLRRLLPARLRARLRVGVPARLMLVLAVIGPGIITANVDNDSGGIAT